MMKGKKLTHPFAPRIKKMMQADDDVGKIAQATPVLIGRALELFLKRLAEGMAGTAAARSARTISPAHLKAYVGSDEVMDFLRQTVASAPDMPEETEEEKQKPKRKRKAEAQDGASPKAAKPRARAKGKAKAEAGGGATGIKDEGDVASPAENGQAEAEEVKAEKAGPGSDAHAAGGAAAAAAAAAAGHAPGSSTGPKAQLPGAPAQAQPAGTLPAVLSAGLPTVQQEEDDYDDL